MLYIYTIITSVKYRQHVFITLIQLLSVRHCSLSHILKLTLNHLMKYRYTLYNCFAVYIYIMWVEIKLINDPNFLQNVLQGFHDIFNEPIGQVYDQKACTLCTIKIYC